MSDFDNTEMLDGDEAEIDTTEAAPELETSAEVASKRVFKVGGTTIHEDASTAALTADQARSVLQSAYPELANATLRETIANGVKTVEFLPQPGRKG